MSDSGRKKEGEWWKEREGGRKRESKRDRERDTERDGVSEWVSDIIWISEKIEREGEEVRKYIFFSFFDYFLVKFKIFVRRRGLIWNTFNAIQNDSSLVDRMPEKTGDYILIVI